MKASLYQVGCNYMAMIFGRKQPCTLTEIIKDQAGFYKYP
jgi:hypothetical protein